ncbi:MAG: hypothetical protein HXY43_21635 [Fischerella sp.]|jgi:hypothetical protein|uniref:hypothetical protein n=1 Tax=Fischerella sp. TaxID=1191 RepID=UPI00183E0740|nr:hypothetical protein [Fischerella sp.]NWF61786.1 hypothetical protein [Fischerella sp.]
MKLFVVIVNACLTLTVALSVATAATVSREDCGNRREGCLSPTTKASTDPSCY